MSNKRGCEPQSPFSIPSHFPNTTLLTRPLSRSLKFQMLGSARLRLSLALLSPNRKDTKASSSFLRFVRVNLLEQRAAMEIVISFDCDLNYFLHQALVFRDCDINTYNATKQRFCILNRNSAFFTCSFITR